MLKKPLFVICGALILVVTFGTGYYLGGGHRDGTGGDTGGQEYIDNVKRELDAERDRLAGERIKLTSQIEELERRERILDERAGIIGSREKDLDSRQERLDEEATRIGREREDIERERSVILADRTGYEQIDQHLVNALMALDVGEDRIGD